MSKAFLSNFMHAAHQITHAQRCLALDTGLTVQDVIDVDDTLLADESFMSLVKTTADNAMSQGTPILSNNLITDPDDVPQTNVHLSGLRVVVTVPLSGYGAVYLDQSVRNGVFERETIDSLMALVQHLLENDQTDLDAGTMAAMYESI